MNRNQFILALALLGLACFSSCKKDEPTNDVLIYRENFDLDTGWTYSLDSKFSTKCVKQMSNGTLHLLAYAPSDTAKDTTLNYVSAVGAKRIFTNFSSIKGSVTEISVIINFDKFDIPAINPHAKDSLYGVHYMVHMGDIAFGSNYIGSEYPLGGHYLVQRYKVSQGTLTSLLDNKESLPADYFFHETATDNNEVSIEFQAITDWDPNKNIYLTKELSVNSIEVHIRTTN